MPKQKPRSRQFVSAESVEPATHLGGAPRRTPAWFWAVMLIPLWVPALWLIFFLVASLTKPSQKPFCAANLRRIGQALYIYAQDSPNGEFPADIAQTVIQGDVTPSEFVCPQNRNSSPSYFYVQGSSTESDPDTVLIFENPTNHIPENPQSPMQEGGYVLYQDGHVEFVRMKELRAIIDAANATGRIVPIEVNSGHKDE